MGREIRRVPPNWHHPKYENGNYIPMFDHDFETHLEEWVEGYYLWKKGEHPDQREGWTYWNWHGALVEPEMCRPKFEEEPTWYQVYETVSEGTPVTPPFETKEKLVSYLVSNGTFWDDSGWSKTSAERFVEAEWAPSGMIISGTFYKSKDVHDHINEEDA